MDRRGALAGLAGLWLAGCGGGGGGGGDIAAAPAPAAASATGPAPVAPPAPAPAAATGFSSTPPAPLVPPFTGSIALWGDSMLPPVYRAMVPLYPNREVFDGGFPGETSGSVLSHQTAETQHRNATTIFWTGHNDVRIDPTTAAAVVKANIAANVALLEPGNDRFLILALVNDALQGQRGTERYNVVTQLDRDLAALYGYHYVDIRSFMVAQSNPNDPQGAADLQADLPSSTLRFDEIHLTGFGADVVAHYLKSILDARGW